MLNRHIQTFIRWADPVTINSQTGERSINKIETYNVLLLMLRRTECKMAAHYWTTTTCIVSLRIHVRCVYSLWWNRADAFAERRSHQRPPSITCGKLCSYKARPLYYNNNELRLQTLQDSAYLRLYSSCSWIPLARKRSLLSSLAIPESAADYVHQPILGGRSPPPHRKVVKVFFNSCLSKPKPTHETWPWCTFLDYMKLLNILGVW